MPAKKSKKTKSKKPGKSHPSPEHILQTGLAFWASKTLLSAIELGVFTELAGQPLDLEALRSRLGVHPRAARDFFDTLVALGFLARKAGVYRNTPDSDLFLDKRKPSYMGGMLEMANARLYPFWGHLTEALRTGQQQNEAKGGGTSPFDVLLSDPVRLKDFMRAMSGISRGASMAIAAKFPWKKYKTVADVGPAQGDNLVQIALAHPHISGVGFDLPQVAPIFEEYVQQSGLSSRLKFVPGTFFTDPLPKADVVIMGHVLHDWGLDDKKMIVRKAYDALPPGGAFIVFEAIIDDDRSKNAFGLLMSLNMLIETSDGFDYSGADCRGWMKEAGFREARVEHLVGPDSMVIGIK